MRVYYDGYKYATQKRGGISTYFNEVIARLPHDVTPIVAYPDWNRAEPPEHRNLALHRINLNGWGSLGKTGERFRIRAVERFSRFDVAHPTYYKLCTDSPLRSLGRPIVLTVHDMIHERFASAVDPHGAMARLKAEAIATAAAIVCVSEHTKRDLVELLRVPEERIRVIYHGVGLGPADADPAAPTPAGPFYLYVGSRARGYKNFDGLLRAFAKIASDCPDLSLAVVGRSWEGHEKALLQDLKLGDRVALYQFATDAHLATLYRKSLAYICPSFYEGFGLPLLEAMNLGTLPLAANTSSIPEVAGDAAVLFDPHDTDALAELLRRFHRDPAARDPWIARGPERCARFSWDRSAAEHVALYRAICSP